MRRALRCGLITVPSHSAPVARVTEFAPVSSSGKSKAVPSGDFMNVLPRLDPGCTQGAVCSQCDQQGQRLIGRYQRDLGNLDFLSSSASPCYKIGVVGQTSGIGHWAASLQHRQGAGDFRPRVTALLVLIARTDRVCG